MSSSTVFGYFVLPALAFGLAYFPITKIVRSTGVAYPKADLKRRFLAIGVDLILLLMLWQYYMRTGSRWFVVAGAAYLLLRDAMRGRSPGKFLCGLVVIDLGTKNPVGIVGSARRNFMFLIPGANLVALFLETITVIRDPQGQRLGDRFAFTQVVDGFGLKDLAESFVQWWVDNGYGILGGPIRRPEHGPRQLPYQWQVNVFAPQCLRETPRRKRRLSRRCSRGKAPDSTLPEHRSAAFAADAAPLGVRTKNHQE
jgi:uncharacterized RDD family membrane protein YckC